jgi:hypothetical protein
MQIARMKQETLCTRKSSHGCNHCFMLSCFLCCGGYVYMHVCMYICIQNDVYMYVKSYLNRLTTKKVICL